MNHLRARLAIRSAFLLAVLYSVLCGLSAQAQDDLRRAVPPPGKALVFIYRSDRTPLPAQVQVVVNSERIAQLTNRSFAATTVNPGYTRVRIGDRSLSTLDLIAAPNQRYFVHVDAIYGVTVVQTAVQLVTELEGARALEQSRFVGNAPPVMAAAPLPPQAQPQPQPSVKPVAPPAPAPAASVAPASPPAPAPAPAAPAQPPVARAAPATPPPPAPVVKPAAATPPPPPPPPAAPPPRGRGRTRHGRAFRRVRAHARNCAHRQHRRLDHVQRQSDGWRPAQQL